MAAHQFSMSDNLSIAHLKLMKNWFCAFQILDKEILNLAVEGTGFIIASFALVL